MTFSFPRESVTFSKVVENLAGSRGRRGVIRVEGGGRGNFCGNAACDSLGVLRAKRGWTAHYCLRNKTIRIDSGRPYGVVFILLANSSEEIPSLSQRTFIPDLGYLARHDNGTKLQVFSELDRHSPTLRRICVNNVE